MTAGGVRRTRGALHLAPEPVRGAERAERALFAPDLPEPISHFADAVRSGNLLFISGIVSLDKQGTILGEGDAAEQMRVILENMRTLLEMNGGTFEDVVKVVVYLTDMDDRPRINPVRQRFFGASRPASTLVEVSKLITRACWWRWTPSPCWTAPNCNGFTPRE